MFSGLEVGGVVQFVSVLVETSRARNVESEDSPFVIEGMSDIDRAVDLATERSATHLLLASRATLASHTRLTATTLAGALPSVAVVVRTPPTTCLALGAAATAADAHGADPVAALNAFEHSLATSTAGVWLRSVGKVDHPNVSWVSTLTSIVSKGYSLPISPTGPVSRGLPDGIDRGASVVVAAGTAEAKAAENWEVTLTRVEPWFDVADIYGSRGFEYLLEPPAAPPVGRRVSAHLQCPACGLTLGTEICPFCHVLTTARESV